MTENKPGENANGTSPVIAASEPEPDTVTFGENFDDLSTTYTETGTRTVTIDLLWVGVAIGIVALSIGGFFVFRKSS